MVKTATAKQTTKPISAKKATAKAAPAPAPATPPEVKPATEQNAEAKRPARGPTAKRILRDLVKLERLARRVEVLADRREAWGSS